MMSNIVLLGRILIRVDLGINAIKRLKNVLARDHDIEEDVKKGHG